MKQLYQIHYISPENKDEISRFSIFKSTSSCIFNVVSLLLIEIIKDLCYFSVVATGEQDPGPDGIPHGNRFSPVSIVQ